MKLSKPIIDEIDKVLAKHYGFTDEAPSFARLSTYQKKKMSEELDFIIRSALPLAPARTTTSNTVWVMS